MSFDEVSIFELEDFALELGRTAGGIARAYFRKSFTVENKDREGFDPVTSADHAIERALRATILERYPEHGIVGEEQGEKTGSSGYRWYIDPIDGTRAFMMGSPLWGTLIGLARDDVPLFGLLCQPVLDEVFLGSPAGSWLIASDSRQRLRTRACTRLEDATLASTHPDMFKGEDAAVVAALREACRLDRYGGDCYNYAMLAAGFVDLVVEAGLKPFDIVPLVPIIENAGGVVTDWQGRTPMAGGAVVAAGTQELHRAALDVLRH
ncbi:MAG TPA: histidinol-phosphatase [Gammaproteobacteria bacterium]|nr:histidinol-phosphatase [Gammaproteobacteria bacterium]